MMEERQNFDTWTAKGSLSMTQRANAKYKEILAGFQAPDMGPGIQKDLDRSWKKSAEDNGQQRMKLLRNFEKNADGFNIKPPDLRNVG